MQKMTTWRELLTAKLRANNETWEDVEHVVLSVTHSWECDGNYGSDPCSCVASLDNTVEPESGGVTGCPFTLWTKNFVYFPARYDGAEWVASVPRNPCDVATRHVGGG